MALSPTSPATQTAQPETVALFVSDLHLSESMPATTAAFFAFLRDQASRTQALYLLGDVFEYWAGDDDLDTPFHQAIINAIAALQAQGVAVFWLAGNRDFLVGSDFATACGLTLLAEPFVATLAGQRVLLVHGDAQCTDDLAYMGFREQVRDPSWQRAFLAQPLAERKALIARMREGSRDALRDKPMAIMDVNPQAIAQLFDAHGVNTMIHGHTHRPAYHATQSPHGQRRRYVLPDWDYDTILLSSRRGGWLQLSASGDLQFVTPH